MTIFAHIMLHSASKQAEQLRWIVLFLITSASMTPHVLQPLYCLSNFTSNPLTLFANEQSERGVRWKRDGDMDQVSSDWKAETLYSHLPPSAVGPRSLQEGLKSLNDVSNHRTSYGYHFFQSRWSNQTHMAGIAYFQGNKWEVEKELRWKEPTSQLYAVLASWLIIARVGCWAVFSILTDFPLISRRQ